MKLLYLTTIAIMLSGFVSPVKNRQITPVLPLAHENIANIPLLEVVLLENVDKQHSEARLKKNIKKVKKLRTKLRSANQHERKMLLAELFTAYVKLHNSDVKTLHSKLVDNYDKQKLHNRLLATRKSLVKLADKLVPLAKSKKTVAHILYHKHIARYFLASAPATKQAIVNELAQSNYKLLPKKVRHKAQLLIAVHRAQLSTLRQYQQAKDRNLAVVAYLGEARAVPRQRAKVIAALYKASAKAAMLPDIRKRELLIYSVQLWRKASGKKQDWNTPPLKLQNFRHLKETRALIERAAISDWYQGRNQRAIDAYYKLAQDAQVKEYSQRLYKQYLLLAKLHTVEARNSKHFDDALRRLQRDYLAATNKGETQPLGGMSAAYIKTVHAKFVQRELAKAQTKNYSTKRKLQTVEIAKKLVISYPDQQVAVYEQVAAIYTALRAHDLSAASWMVLVKATDQKTKYLRKAITSQSTYLNYSATPRFNAQLAIPAKHINDYRKLRAMYRQFDGLQTKPNWHSKAHLGLLLIAADKRGTAASLWDKAVVTDSEHVYAKEASAHLLHWYEVEQRWLSLEKISRLLLDRKVDVPLKQGSVQAKLAQALLQQGIIAQQQGEHKVAIAKFAEYKTFKHAPQLDFVTWQLSRLYKQTKQYKQFFTMLTDYVVNYPQAQHLRQALLEGGHYAGIMAEEEHAVYFYNRFLKAFPNDHEEPRLRRKLITLYQANGNYYAAISELSELQKFLHLSGKQRTNAAMQAIDLEFKHGSTKNAMQKINTVIASNIASDNQLGKVYYYKVSLTIGKRRLDKIAQYDYQQLLALEKQITRARQVAKQKRFFNDALALITLVTAHRILVPEVNENEVLRTTNINGYLQQKFAGFTNGKATYLQACQLNRGTICITALYQLARFGEKYLTNIEKINIADTLSGNIVDPFERKKSKMITTIKDTIRHAHDEAMRMARAGKGTPMVADQVTWLAKNALDFRGLENSSYFQFSK